MTLDNTTFVSYGVPFLVLNVLTVISIIKMCKKLSPTFFAIYLLTSAMNLLTYLNAWVVLRLYHERLFNFYYHFTNWTVFLHFVHEFLTGYLFYVQNINSALLTLDRFIMIVALNWVETWKRRWFIVAVVLYVSAGVANFLAAGFYDLRFLSSFEYDAASDMFRRVSRGGTRVSTLIGTEVVYGLVFVGICAVLNFFAWIRIRRMEAMRTADRSVFFISLAIFISQSVNILILVLLYYFLFISFNFTVYSAVFTAMNYTSDVFSLGPGFYMIVVPGPIRSQFLKIVRRCIPCSMKSTTSDNNDTSSVAVTRF